MNPRIPLILLVTLSTLLRWFWNVGNPISPEAAYLALCGKTPAVAYFDGPPGTALMTALGVRWAGTTAFGANLLWPFFAALATIAIYQLIAPLSGKRTAFSLALLANLLPAFNLAALHPGTALPVAMFAVAFSACAWRALGNNHMAWWIAAGLCAAGGLMFSYTAWFFIPALTLILLTSRRWRRQFFAVEFWMAVLPPLFAFALLLIWNSRNDWVHFIGGTWQTSMTFYWLNIPPALASANAALSPLALLVCIAGLLVIFRTIRTESKARFLAIQAFFSLGIAIYAVLTKSSLQTAGLTTALLTLPLLPWLAHSDPTEHSSNFIRSVLASPLLLPSVLLTSALATIFTLIRLPTPQNFASIPVIREIETLRVNAVPGERLFLIAENASLASLIALHLHDVAPSLPGHPPIYTPESPFADSQYAFWPRYDEFVESTAPIQAAPGTDRFTEQAGGNPFLGRSALYITRQTPEDLPQAITAAFASHRLLATISAPGGTLYIFLCENYQTLPL